MADYGATLDGVRGLLPHRELSAASQPTATQAEALLDRASGWVAARVGGAIALLPEAEAVRATELARTAVELGGAALIHDASHPATTGRGDSAYGPLLWTRFREALADLLGLLGLSDGAGGGGEVAAAREPLYRFPDPAFSREVGW